MIALSKSLSLIFAIAGGGALGAVARHLMAAQIARLLGSGFPWGILAVNVLGSFVMGVLVELFALRWSVGQEVRAFLTVGILGGFTTFSSFSLDAALLVERGQLAVAAAYVIASVAVSIIALFLGLWLVRSVLA